MKRFPRPVSKPAAPREVTPAAPKLCAKCQSEMEPAAQFCGECGTPVKAGLKPKRSMADIRDKAETRKNRGKIQSGRNYLLLVGILELAVCLVMYFAGSKEKQEIVKMDTPEQRLVLVETTGFSAAEIEREFWIARHWFALCFLTTGLPAIIYFGLYMWANTNPLPAVTAGLVTYITSVIFWIVITRGAGAGGVLVWLYRAAVVGALSDAIRSATSERRMAEKKKRQKDRERRERAAEMAEDAESAG